MALKKGVSLTFGLMNALVTVDSGIEPKPSNKTVCVGTNGHAEHDPKAVSQIRRCADCGDVGYTDTKKARQIGETFVILEAEELAEANVDAAAYKNRAVISPVPAAQMELKTNPGDKLYYLTPEAGNEDPYNLIANTIETEPDKAFMVRWAARSVVSTFVLRVRDGVIVMQERVTAAATKALPVVNFTPPSEAHVKMAKMLVDTMVTDFDPADYADVYEEKVQVLLAEKTANLVPAQASAATKSTASTPVGQDAIMAALRASVDAKKAEAKTAKVTKIEDAPKKRASKKAAA